MQIGFLTEWQLYAQMIEGDTWKGQKMDKAKIDKMSGMLLCFLVLYPSRIFSEANSIHRSANRAVVRTYASYPEARVGRCRS